MTVYVDVLIFINGIIDYLILRLSSLITGYKIKNLRLCVTAVVASLFSLIIFLPYYGVFAELCFTVVSSLLICLVGYGFLSIKKFLKAYVAYLAVSVIYNGLITCLWMYFKPNGMLLNNSIAYFNISALELIGYTAFFYVIIKFSLYIIRRTSPYASRCNLRLIHMNNCVEVTALVDTGNSLKDIYFGRPVIIADESIAYSLFGRLNEEKRLLLPYKTVDGSGVISAYSCEKTFVNNQSIGCTLVAVAEENIDSDYKAIINPEMLNVR